MVDPKTLEGKCEFQDKYRDVCYCDSDRECPHKSEHEVPYLKDEQKRGGTKPLCYLRQYIK